MAENCNSNCKDCTENCDHRVKMLETNSLNKIKHIIGVVSGKGGVGKSFVTSLLASTLNKKGYKVGILDGDITGPSIPKAFNVHGNLEGDGHSLIFPYVTPTGIKMVSSNLLLAHEDDPIIWRGTLISSLLSQFYVDVLWEELDYLLIDMPPGTGDVTLTAFQSIPLEGIIIVSTPQDLVSLIVKKQINMAKMMNINVIGLVENMAYVECPSCHEKFNPFGVDNVETLVKEENIKLLAKLPLNGENATAVDKGKIEFIESKEIEGAIEALEVLNNK